MKSLFKMENIVEDVLIRFPSARDDNCMLVYEVYMETNPLLVNYPFKEILLNHQMYALPSFESIFRARRKVVTKNPTLRPSKLIQKLREENEDYYKFFSKKGDYEKRIST